MARMARRSLICDFVYLETGKIVFLVLLAKSLKHMGQHLEPNSEKSQLQNFRT